MLLSGPPTFNGENTLKGIKTAAQKINDVGAILGELKTITDRG